MPHQWSALLLAAALRGATAADAAVRSSHAEEEMTMLQATSNVPVGSKVKAVVNNFKKTKDLKWLKAAGIPVDEVGVNAKFGKLVAETQPWLQWVADHYDDLPPYAAFLHGDEESWHSHLSGGRIHNATPAAFESVTHPICRSIEHVIHHSSAMLDPTFKAIFGISFEEGFKKWGMHNYHCCGEFVVSRSAMRKNDRRIYQALSDLILRTHADWGHTIEWIYENLFTKPTRPTEHVLASLALLPPEKLSEATFQAEQERRHGTKKAALFQDQAMAAESRLARERETRLAMESREHMARSKCV